MIVRHTSGGLLLDAAALFVQFGRRFSLPTIRKHCEPVGRDPETGLQLYDLEAAEDALSEVKSRVPHKRPTARS